MDEKLHVPLPPDTHAYICAECGAVALDPENICTVQGSGTRADWCGGKSFIPPKHCRHRVNVDRYQCRNCGQTAINEQLLCEPEKLEIPGS
jgi:RNA polymerase subunit RPABC4/transcription elongation factor Spt4